MQWLTKDDWYAWWPVDPPQSAESETYRKNNPHWMDIPDELHARLMKAIAEVKQIHDEIDKL